MLVEAWHGQGITLYDLAVTQLLRVFPSLFRLYPEAQN